VKRSKPSVPTPERARVARINESPDSPAFLYSPTAEEVRALAALYEAGVVSRYWAYLLRDSEEPGTLNVFRTEWAEGRNNPLWRPFLRTLRAGGGDISASLRRKLERGGWIPSSLSLAEQRVLARDGLRPPTNFAELRSLVRPAIRSLVYFSVEAEFERAGSFEGLVGCLIDRIRRTRGPGRSQSFKTPSRAAEFLILAEDRGWLLLPLDLLHEQRHLFAGSVNPLTSSLTPIPEQITRCDYLLDRERVAAFREFFTVITSRRKVHVHSREFGIVRSVVRDLLLSTSVAGREDLTPELLEAFRDLELRTLELTEKGNTTRHHWFTRALYTELTEDWRLAHPDVPVRTTVDDSGFRRRFEQFALECPRLALWFPLLVEYIEHVRRDTVVHTAYSCGLVAEYIASRDDIPSDPADATRAHFVDLPEALVRPPRMRRANQSPLSPRTRNGAVREAFNFFEWLALTRGAPARNPVDLKFDLVGGRIARRARTHRRAIPSRELKRLRDLITADDYAWAKTWSEDRLKAFDRVTGRVEYDVWCPVRAVFTLLMLTVPLRTVGAFLLDSGEIDEEVFDPRTRAMTFNDDPRAIAGRREGALTLVGTPSGASIVSLRVPAHKGCPAYLVDYVPPELVAALQMLVEWQRRYGTPPELVTRGDDPLDYMVSRNPHKRNHMPYFVPLFRDPFRPLGQQGFPVSRGRFHQFYSALCARAEDAAKGRDGQPSFALTKRVRHVEKNRVRTRRTARYDAHTLRVSLATNLMREGGLPIMSAMQLLGHATPAMTLYYYNPSIEDLHETLKTSYERCFEAGLTPDRLEQEYERNRDRLVATSEAGFVAFDQNRDNRGLWTVGTAGICPGTSCSDGGPLVGGSVHGPVPGGRCPLCRFYLTGPAFLVGLATEANVLLWTIKRKADELQTLCNRRAELEPTGSRGELSRLENSIDRLERDTDLDWQHWLALTELVAKSVALSTTPREAPASDRASKALLVCADPEPVLRAALVDTTYFELLHAVTVAAEVVPDFLTVQHAAAVLEKHTVLDELLVHNGLDPLLIRVPEPLRLAAGNRFSELLIRQVSQEGLERLLVGETTFAEVPGLERRILELSRQARALAEAARKELV
jgi:integrase